MRSVSSASAAIESSLEVRSPQAAALKNALIVGAGGIGAKHIRGFLATGRVNVSVCEPDQTKLSDIAKNQPIDRTFDDFEKLRLADFDLAVLAVPAHLHIPMGKRLAEAGVPFLTEKPLSIDWNGVEELMDLVNRQKITVRVGFLRRSLSYFQQLKQLLSSEKIGRVRMAYLNASAPFPKYRPDYQRTYYGKASMGGGAILDCASHFIDFVIWMLGNVTEVGAMYDRLMLEGVECEDSLLLNLRMASGALVNLTVNQFQLPTVEVAEFIGERGNLRIDSIGERLEISTGSADGWQNIDNDQPCLTTTADPIDMFSRQADDFLNAVEGKPDCMCTLPEAATNLQVCLAAKDSYRAKKIIGIEAK